MQQSLPRRALAEAIGTFALVFAGCGAIVITAQTGQPGHVGVGLTFGLVVMAMIYAVGETSGAHFNPAVTVGFSVARRFPWRDVGPYVAAQLGGAILAAGLLRLLFPHDLTLGATLPIGSQWQAFVLEIVLTAGLMFVILHVATGSKEQGLMAGIAIGATVGLEAIFAGPICMASMNPARSLGPALVAGVWKAQWLYVLAPPIGSVLAVGLWCVTRPIPPGASVD